MPDPADDIHRIRVVNRNTFTIKDRWDGIPVELPPGKAVSLTPEVANHILGYPGDAEDMHRHMAKRWGWNLPHHLVIDDEGLMLWQRQCLAITVTAERYELRRIEDGNEPIPADGDDIRVHEPTAPSPRKAKNAKRKAQSERMKKLWAERRAKGLTKEVRQSERNEAEMAAAEAFQTLTPEA